ncbi:MAG TPA: hypothetical protein VFV01_31585, partial [Spirillospora sp.]|nr:hypothetical protein [Spirillospora sp.]
MADAPLVDPALLARLVTCATLPRAQRAIALDVLDGLGASGGPALDALCAIATDRAVAAPARASAAARLLMTGRAARTPPDVLEAIAADTGIDAWLRHGALRRLGAEVHTRIAVDPAADPEVRVWSLRSAFAAGEENGPLLRPAAWHLASNPGLSPEMRLQAMNALAADPSSAWLLLKIAEIAEIVPGGVPEEFADIAAGGVAERLASASEGTARTLLLAPGLPERVRAVALERLLQGFPRATARLLRGVLLDRDTLPDLRGLAAGAIVGRAAGPLLALVTDGHL